jgi:hypothetical protein
MNCQPYQRFYDLCVLYDFYYDDLLALAESAGVTKQIVDAMFVGTAVLQVDAERMLAALRAKTGAPWTLQNTGIPLLDEADLPGCRPSLLDIWTRYHFDIARLATLAEVSEQTIRAMLCYAPVSHAEAERVLASLSTVVKCPYSLELVYVTLEEGESSCF